MLTVVDDLAAALAAYRHVQHLWLRRHDPMIRRWIRRYFLQIRCLQDQVEMLAVTMRREREESKKLQDEETQLLSTV